MKAQEYKEAIKEIVKRNGLDKKEVGVTFLLRKLLREIIFLKKE